MVSLNIFKGFSVIRTSSIQETSDFICNMAYKIKRNIEQNKLPWYIGNTTVDNNAIIDTGIGSISNNDEGCIETPIPYCSVVKKVKKENVTATNIGEIILCQIPGISSVSAVAIMNKFKTIKNLIEEMSRDPNCLNDIVITNAKGTRKINKTILVNIQKFLCLRPDEITS